MTDTDILAFVKARIAEEEWWAREASRPRDGAPPPEGVRWHWVDGNTDEPLAVDPVLGSELNDGGSAELRSVEEFPSRSAGTLPLFAVPYAQEVPTVVGGHIALHDPTQVLREVALKRYLLELHSPYTDGMCSGCTGGPAPFGDVPAPCSHVRAMADVWSDHPDYNPSWRMD